MDARLKRQLLVVARRQRSLRLWTAWAVVWLLFAICGLMLYWSSRGQTEATLPYPPGVVLLMAAVVVAFMVSLVIWFHRIGWTSLAHRIESKYPRLNQRLLTAVGQSDHATGGYLQQAVLDETLHHSHAHPWAETFSIGRLWAMVLLNIPAVVLLLLAASLLGLSSSSRLDPLNPAANITTQPLALEVQPGDTEVERGTGLVVTARFPQGVEFSQGSLHTTSQDGSHSIAMTRSLDDPLLAAYIPTVDQPLDYRVETADGSSREFHVTVFEYPALLRCDATLQFPEYAQMETKTVQDTRRVTAVEGTRLTWHCQLNKAVASAVLQPEQGPALELIADADDPSMVSVELDLQQSQRWTLKLTDDRGRENKFPPQLIARVLPNQPPELKLVNARDVRVSPLEELAVGATVRDDFGVGRVGLSYTVPGRTPVDKVLQEEIGKGQQVALADQIDFESLEVEPDMLLAYHFWAEDVGPDGQPRRISSDMFFAEVRPFEEIFREGEPPPSGESPPPSEQAAEAEKLAELQKQIINATWTLVRRETALQPSTSYAEDIQLTLESQQNARQLLDELKAELEDPQSIEYADAAGAAMDEAVALLLAATRPDLEALPEALSAEQAAYQALLKLRAREFNVVRSQQQQSSSSSSSASRQQMQQQLDELELKNDENRYEAERQAETQQEAAEREARLVLNLLKELAQRQEDLNKQIQQLQTALQAAETEAEKEEIRRQLKRLREQQQQLLRETDELAQRMQENPSDSPAMQQTQQQLEEARENVQQAADALAQNNPSQALAAGTRAEQQFEEMKEEVRRETSGQFEDALRNMRDDVRELQDQQDSLAEQMQAADAAPENSKGLRAPEQRQALGDAMRAQSERLGELMNDMEQTVQEAETSEPLLAEKLYESHRRVQQDQLRQRLEMTGELLDRGLQQQAEAFEGLASEQIEELKQDIEDAAESVIGDGTEGLRRAMRELDDLTEALNNEIAEATGQTQNAAGESSPGEQANPDQQTNPQSPSSPGQADEGEQAGQPSGRNEPMPAGEQPSPGEQPGQGQQPGQEQQPDSAGQPGQGGQPGQAEQPEQQGQPSQGEPSQGQPGQGEPSEGQPSQGQPGQGEPSEGQPSQGQPGQGQPGQGQPGQGGQPGDGSERLLDSASPQTGGRGGGNPMSSPLTGEGYREWSDRLRDVEELVDDPDLRSEATRIRERAREVRRELNRHSKDPQWPLVTDMIAEPLERLRMRVSEELIRRSAEKNSLVPVDRDPVPEGFDAAVQKYYERIGSGQ